MNNKDINSKSKNNQEKYQENTEKFNYNIPIKPTNNYEENPNLKNPLFMDY
jgi:hypothetical protein